MNIIFAINQAAALKLGINAPNSTQGIDIDPAELTQDERDMLASKIIEGHKATSIFLDRPDLQGVRDKLNELIAKKRENDAETQRYENKLRQEASDKLIEVLANTETTKLGVWINKRGEKDDHGVVYKTVEVPCELSVGSYWYKYLTPEQQTQHDDFVAQQTAARRALIDATAEELRQGPYQEWLAKQAAEKADYQSLYQRLPETLRKRDAAGFADQDEITKTIRQLIREDAGLSEYGTWRWYSSRRPASLTDEEFEALEAFRALLPDEAGVEVKEVTDKGEPLSDEWGEPELDDDGDPAYEAINRRVVAVAEWKRAGVTTKAVCTLGHRADDDA